MLQAAEPARCIVQLEPNSPLQHSAFCKLQACLQLSLFSFPLQQELQFANVAVEFCPFATSNAIAAMAVELFCPFATRSAMAGIAVAFSWWTQSILLLLCCSVPSPRSPAGPTLSSRPPLWTFTFQQQQHTLLFYCTLTRIRAD